MKFQAMFTWHQMLHSIFYDGKFIKSSSNINILNLWYVVGDINISYISGLT